MQDRWVKVAELAHVFGVTRPSVYAWMRQGKLPKPIDLGGFKWDRKQLQEWLKENYNGSINV